MKKALWIGMAAITVSMAFSSAHAVQVKTSRELLIDYTKQAREHVYGKAGSAKGVNESVLAQVKENLLTQLEMPALASKLRPVLSGKAGADRMDTVVSIIAAKKMSAEIAKKDIAEGQSIEAAAIASAKLISNADLVGAKKSTELSIEDASMVTTSLQKAESLPTRILTDFSKVERDSYTQVFERYDRLSQTSKKSAEENLVDAVMQVKNVDRKAALEIIRKLKECV